MARRNKKVEEQMDIFEEGGLKDEGGTVDPVSGNDVPSGSTQSEVRDDIPAQLSEGEFVFPADVVRYIGLENLMELRQKAKTGLQKMEDMGQMGNSEEATISDDVAFEDTIDKTIEALPMAMGGAVPSPMKKQRTPFKRPVQNFKIGGTPQVGNPLTSTQTTPVATQPTTLPGFSSFIQQPARQQAEGLRATVESKEFIGPNGERITIQFVNGRPATPVPDGYREMTAEEKAEAMKPKIEQPEVVQNQEDSSDDRERKEQEEARYAGYVSTMETLAELSPTFAKEWEKTPHKSGSKLTAGLSALATMGASAGVQERMTLADADKAVEELAGKYGLNPEDYKHTKFFDKLVSEYDHDRFARDAAVADAVTKSIAEIGKSTGVAPTSLKRTEIDTDGDGRISQEEAKKAEEDLFMDIDGEDVSETPAAEDKQSEAAADAGLGNNQASADKEGGTEKTTSFAKGGLASPKPIKPKRKPTMKRGALASKK